MPFDRRERHRWGGPKLESASSSGEAFSCWAYASDHQFVGDAAYINLEIEALYRRTREMPLFLSWGLCRQLPPEKS